jgi:hypothetical protein
MWCSVFWTGAKVSHYNWRKLQKTHGSGKVLGPVLSFALATFLRADSIGLLFSSLLRLRPQATVAWPMSGQVHSKLSRYEVVPHQLTWIRTCCKVSCSEYLHLTSHQERHSEISKASSPAASNIISSVAITKYMFAIVSTMQCCTSFETK